MINLLSTQPLPALPARRQRQLPRHHGTSTHHIKGFHPPANLSPCKQPEFDVRPHFVTCLDQRLALNAPHLHVMSQRMLPVEDDWLWYYPYANYFVSSFIFSGWQRLVALYLNTELGGVDWLLWRPPSQDFIREPIRVRASSQSFCDATTPYLWILDDWIKGCHIIFARLALMNLRLLPVSGSLKFSSAGSERLHMLCQQLCFLRLSHVPCSITS